MIHALTPILYLTKRGVPKPPFLDPSIIQQLTDKVRSMGISSRFPCIFLSSQAHWNYYHYLVVQ